MFFIWLIGEYDLVSEYLDGLLTKIRRKDHCVEQEEPSEEFDFNFSFSPEKKETCIQKNKELPNWIWFSWNKFVF